LTVLGSPKAVGSFNPPLPQSLMLQTATSKLLALVGQVRARSLCEPTSHALHEAHDLNIRVDRAVTVKHGRWHRQSLFGKSKAIIELRLSRG
jgi:hypothetical protein